MCMNNLRFVLLLCLAGASTGVGQEAPSAEQLSRWLKRFPAADADGDGTLTIEEARAFQQNSRGRRRDGQSKGAPRDFAVDPRWEKSQFPPDAVAFKSPAEIRALYQQVVGDRQPAVVSFEKPDDGALRVVGTGHSFMAPGYRTLPLICRAAGMSQPLYTHTGGGMTGSARYKWEQENGIFGFEGQPHPKLLSSIANAEWDAMLWGPYFNDRPQYYGCWIEFCLRHNPGMKFYLSDAWPQLYQLSEVPKSESEFTATMLKQMNAEKQRVYSDLISQLRNEYSASVFLLPTSDAMTLAAEQYLRGELPGVEGLHRAIGGKQRSLWTDVLGHLGPGFDRLEGYVFFATLYGKSPEQIGKVNFPGSDDYPGEELDRMFRKIAWQAVVQNPLSGVADRNLDGVADE